LVVGSHDRFRQISSEQSNDRSWPDDRHRPTPAEWLVPVWS